VDNILERLQPIFQDVLDQPGLQVSAEDSGQTVAGWDSLAHISLVAAIEHEFKVRFALGELEELKNLGDMIALIQTKRTG